MFTEKKLSPMKVGNKNITRIRNGFGKICYQYTYITLINNYSAIARISYVEGENVAIWNTETNEQILDYTPETFEGFCQRLARI